MSTTAWDLSKLRNHLRSSEPTFAFANEVLHSLSQSVFIFRYHMATARDSLKGLVDAEHPTEPENFMLLFGNSEKIDEFNYARLVSEAHLIGCLHTARGMWDHFGQLLNLLTASPRLEESKCDIRKVLDRMPDSELRQYVATTLSSHWYRYVVAFVNTAKHRRLVQHLFSVSPEEDRAGVKLGAFRYEAESFPSYWGTEILAGVVDVKNRVIGAGRLLNAAVLAQ